MSQHSRRYTYFLFLSISYAVLTLSHNLTNFKYLFVNKVSGEVFIRNDKQTWSLDVSNRTNNEFMVRNDEGFEDDDVSRSSNTSESSAEGKITVNTSKLNNCQRRIPKLSPRPLPRIALASFMGSGNTWTRHLIQQMSGIATGSMYCDQHLRIGGFPYECYNDYTRLSVVKTHRTKSHYVTSQFDKVILLLRNPFDALISATNWKYAGHVGHASDERIHKGIEKGFKTLLRSYVNLVHLYVQQFKGPVLVLQYEHMKDNLQTSLKQLADFLQLDISQEDIDCTVHLQNGNFHRQSDSVARQRLIRSVFAGEREAKIQEAVTEVENILQQKFDKTFTVIKTLSELFR